MSIWMKTNLFKNMNITKTNSRVFVWNKDNSKILLLLRIYGSGRFNRVVHVLGDGIKNSMPSNCSLPEPDCTLTNHGFIKQVSYVRLPTNAEQNTWPGVTQVTDIFNFYAGNVDETLLSLPQPNEFEKYEWVSPDQIKAFANTNNAIVAYGILEISGNQLTRSNV